MRIPRTPPPIGDILAGGSADWAKASADPAMRDFIAEAERGYWHWDKVRVIARDRGVDPGLAWLSIKLGRTARWKTTDFLSVHGEPLRYTVPDVLQRELMLVDRELAGRLSVDSADPLTKEHRDRFIVSSLMDEAISSSMLEGASTTVRVAKDMLRKGRRPRTPGERMVANNYRAIMRVRELLEEDLSLPLLFELHRILGEGSIPDAEVGRLRTAGDRVEVVDNEGNTVFAPPPAAELESRLSRYCAFANDRSNETADGFMHPVVRGMLVHFQFSYLHPFCDGNGRTARILSLWSMLRRGYWLFEWLPLSRVILRSAAQYGRAFLYTETDDFDATYFLVYHAKVLSKCRAELQQFIERKRREMLEARSAFSNDESLNARQQALLLHSVRHPGWLYTVREHQTSHQVTYETARSDLLALERAGYLVKKKIGKKFVFEAAPKIA
jgi:Fic family protein